MADDDQTPDTGAGSDDDAPTTPPAPKAEPDKDWQAEADKWKALARKHEKTANDLKPLADKAKELEDAGRSELERATADAQAAQARATKAEQDLLRVRVALRNGLNETQAKRLVGETEEELDDDAKDLLSSFKPVEEKKTEETTDETNKDEHETREQREEREANIRQRPRERLRSGAIPDADNDVVEMNPKKLADMVPRGLLG